MKKHRFFLYWILISAVGYIGFSIGNNTFNLINWSMGSREGYGSYFVIAFIISRIVQYLEDIEF